MKHEEILTALEEISDSILKKQRTPQRKRRKGIF